MKAFPLAVFALLLLATPATASDRCVNYVSEVQSQPGEIAFTSFNPRTKESIVVAKKIGFTPDSVVWPINFGFVTYRDQATGQWFKLEWKSGAVPIPISTKHSSLSPKPQNAVKRWYADSPEVVCSKEAPYYCTITANVPADREVHVGAFDGCNWSHFAAPLAWVNTQTGEKKVLFDAPQADSTVELQISTADNFILLYGFYVSEGSDDLDAIVADLNTGEVLLRIGPRSGAIGWAACPAK